MLEETPGEVVAQLYHTTISHITYCCSETSSLVDQTQFAAYAIANCHTGQCPQRDVIPHPLVE